MRSVYIGRAELLISTGMPGLYRLATFFFIQHIYSIADLGRVASSLAIAQMASFFTAIGWATLILVRVSRATDMDEAREIFYGISWMALCVTIVITACGALSYFFNYSSIEIKAILELLWSWTAYQLFRHFFVAQKRYRILIIFDVVLTAASFAAILISHEIGLTPSTALSIALCGISIWMAASIGFPARNVLTTPFEKKGLEFGLANFVSGGMVLSLSPLSAYLCGPAFTGVFSLINSVSTLGALLPRAISLSQLPVLAKRKAAGEPLAAIVRKMRNKLVIVNSAVLAGSIIILLGVVLIKRLPGMSQGAAIGVVVLMTVLYAAGASAITHSNILMVFEKSKTGLLINIHSAALFFVIASCIVVVKNSAGLWILLTAAILVTVLKNMLVIRAASTTVSSYELV